MSGGLRFKIAGSSYLQLLQWQQEIDQRVLRHQIEARGQALVTSRRAPGEVIQVRTLPDTHEYAAYYGEQGGAYRFSFHPLSDACELEVVNQMGGFAYYYPRRFDPLHLYLFDAPEPIDSERLPDSGGCLYEDVPAARAMRFTISPEQISAFYDWPWSRRPLTAYDFQFIPGAGCQVRVRVRESGVQIDLSEFAGR